MTNVVRFISDLHLGHLNMAIRRGFSSVAEHDEHIIKQWNSVVSKRDTTYILGDITMERSSSYYLLDRLNGIKKVILGNHDKPSNIPLLLNHVNSVAGMVKMNGMALTHCPIHPREFDRYSHNIHGHIHEYYVTKKNFLGISVIDDRYINVCCEAVNYIPRTLSELKLNK